VGGLQQGDVVRALALLANAGGVLVQGDAREATGDAGERLARACALQGDARPQALGGFVRRAARTRQVALLHLALTIAVGNDVHGTAYVAVVPRPLLPPYRACTSDTPDPLGLPTAPTRWLVRASRPATAPAAPTSRVTAARNC